jgi:hypothetical protein
MLTGILMCNVFSVRQSETDRFLRSGLAVVFAEDIPDIPAVVDPTGTLLSIILPCVAHVLLYNRVLEQTLSNIQQSKPFANLYPDSADNFSLDADANTHNTIDTRIRHWGISSHQ